MTRNKHSWKKTWILPELRAKKGRRPLKASLSRAGKIELVSKSWPSELSVGRVLVKYRPSGGEVSAGCRPTCLSVHVDRHSADISAECRSPYWLIVSTDTRSTDALSTHDPIHFLLQVAQLFLCLICSTYILKWLWSLYQFSIQHLKGCCWILPGDQCMC